MWNVEKRITEIKCTRNISFPEARKIVEQTQEQPSYVYVTKKGNEEKEDTKQELNKLINELKNLIEILKMIVKETIKGHISTDPDECDTQPKSGKKTLSNRFSPMDIDPVETPTEDETTTHITTDTINLQKRLHKKNKYQRQPNRKWNNKSYPKKWNTSYKK